MNITILDKITLSNDKEYVVCSKTNYEGKNYYYLLEKGNLSNLMFCYEEGKDLVEVTDKTLVTRLLPYFYKSGKEGIKERKE